MKKRGSVLLILGIILGVVLISGGGAGVYFYKFHVFEELRFCISENSKDTEVLCNNVEFCIEEINKNLTSADEISQAPEFIKEKFYQNIEDVVYCEETCKIKEIRGYEEFGDIDSCQENEKEILIEVKGKEGLEILKYLREIEEED